ncbi:MAG: hypothetical protein JWO91_2696 [Acidobacteriaceae bacterium]|nr:hypothetical protein [Acidobacteriaceae bacterium]
MLHLRNHNPKQQDVGKAVEIRHYPVTVSAESKASTEPLEE